jgi:hypothetical protein
LMSFVKIPIGCSSVHESNHPGLSLFLSCAPE